MREKLQKPFSDLIAPNRFRAEGGEEEKGIAHAPPEIPSPPAGIPKPPPRYAKAFRRAGRFLLFGIAFFAPFLFLPSITEDPVGINKAVIIGFLTLGAFVCFLGCILEERTFAYPRSWFSFSFLLFFVWEGVSTALSVAPTQSLYGGLRAPDSFMSMAIYALVFFLSFFFFRREDLRKIGVLAGSGLLLAIVIGVLSPFNPVGAAAGWGILAIAAVVAIVVRAPGEFARTGKILFFAAIFVAFVALFILNYAWLWFALAASVVIVAALRFGPTAHFRYVFAIVVLALFFALVGSRLPAFTRVILDVRPGVQATIAALPAALNGWRILAGSGPATFSLDFSTYPTLAVNQGHDFILTLLATSGIVGCLLFLLMIAAAVRPLLALRTLRTDFAMVVAGTAFLLATLFFSQAFFASFILLFLCYGVVLGETSRREVVFVGLSHWRSFFASLGIMVLAALSLAAAYVIGEKYAAAIVFRQSNVLAAAGDLDHAFVKVNTAVGLDRTDEYLRGGSQILVAEARRLAATSDPSLNIQLPEVVASAIQAAEGAANLGPRDPANWGNLGSVYEAVIPVVQGADMSAQGSYGQAATLDPANPQWDLAIGRVLMESADLLSSSSSSTALRTKKWNDAETFLEKAIAIKDDYTDARVLLIQLYLKEGNVAQAISKVQELKQQNPLDPGAAFELGYLYYRNNQIDQAQEEFQVATILNPNYANAHYFLGLIYDQKGMTAQALDEFRKVAVLNPDNAEVEQIIANLMAGKPALTSNVATSTLSGGAAPPNEIPVPQRPGKNGK